jgi:hypothetical protein
MILLVDLHGLTVLTESDIKMCQILPMPEGMSATFLEATPCGVNNLSCVGYWKYMVKTTVQIMVKDNPTKEFAHECQRFFRREKKNFLDKVDFLQVASKEEMAAFRRNKGWDIVECTTDYVNKYYEEDPDPLLQLNEVNVFYSTHPDFPVGTIITDVKSRKSLLNYLHKEGVKNPLIIDSSCSGIIGSPREARHARNLTKRQRIGGRLTKRPKVKKLIHFA